MAFIPKACHCIDYAQNIEAYYTIVIPPVLRDSLVIDYKEQGFCGAM